MKVRSNHFQLAHQLRNDFESIMKQYLKGSFYFDVEDFKSPSIVVTDIPNKFKGVIATEDIKVNHFVLFNIKKRLEFLNRNSKREGHY